MTNGPQRDQEIAGDKGSKFGPLEITVMSFGYKEGSPPIANLVFDVRFLKNPFWVEELKPLTGKDLPVQEYVLQQPLAIEFLKSVLHMLDTLLPRLSEQNITDFTIAFGCTGGQHRSATMVEALASELLKRYPQHQVTRYHRELESATDTAAKDAMKTAVSAQRKEE